MPKKIRLTYVTSSDFKKQEAEIILSKMSLADGSLSGNRFEFVFERVSILERLEIKIDRLVREEVVEAFQMVKSPCFVEHAGLIFSEFESQEYPGGLTKPMWDNLGKDFLSEVVKAPRKAIAKAVVAATNGKKVYVFEGVTRGSVSGTSTGDRDFYWDPVFIPEGSPDGMTYAQLAAHKDYGLEVKVMKFSQSSKAILKFLDAVVKMESSEPGSWS